MIKNSNLYIEIISNSSIGIEGNIGQRISSIIDHLENKNISFSVLARKSSRKYSKFCLIPKGYVYFSRLLNFLRIYLFRKIDSRLIDNYFFSRFILISLLFRRFPPDKVKILHITEYLPSIIEIYKKKGFKIVLDIPIAPLKVSESLNLKLKKRYFNVTASALKRETSCFNRADILIAPSFFVKESLEKLYAINKKKIRLVPFGVNINDFKSANFRNKKNGISFCFVGNVSSRKGIHFLLDVWQNKNFSQDQLHLFGRVYPDINYKISKMHTHNIYLHGFTDVSKELAKSDVYVFPSLLEGSSKSIYEAMAAKLPVITTFNSGSIITHKKDGLIIKPGDSKSLKNAMLLLKSKPNIRKKLSSAGFKTVKAYSWLRYARNLENIYKSLR